MPWYMTMWQNHNQHYLKWRKTQNHPFKTRDEAGTFVCYSWVLRVSEAGPGMRNQVPNCSLSRSFTVMPHMVSIAFATARLWPRQYTQTSRMKLSAVPTSYHFPPLPPCVACGPETPNHTLSPRLTLPFQALRKPTSALILFLVRWMRF